MDGRGQRDGRGGRYVAGQSEWRQGTEGRDSRGPRDGHGGSLTRLGGDRGRRGPREGWTAGDRGMDTVGR